MNKDTHHDTAVLDAEIRRLVHALQRYGVLPRDVLRRESHADHWHEARFEDALGTAVRRGQIERLPFEFYRLCPTRDGRA